MGLSLRHDAWAVDSKPVSSFRHDALLTGRRKQPDDGGTHARQSNDSRGAIRKDECELRVAYPLHSASRVASTQRLAALRDTSILCRQRCEYHSAGNERC